MCRHDDESSVHTEEPGGIELEASDRSLGLRRRTLLAGATGASALGLLAPAAAAGKSLGATTGPAGTPTFYRIDPHVHSVVSGDATPDVGILAHAATAPGSNPYAALFLTDHHLASRATIAGQSGLHGTFTGSVNGATGDVLDGTSKWSVGTYGSATSRLTEAVTTPVRTSARSLHLKTQSAGYSEAFAWYRRGPSLATTDASITLAIFPTRIDAGCSIYVSGSLGGEATLGSKYVDGFTTEADLVARPGRTIRFVWQFSADAVPLSLPDASGGTTTHQYQMGNLSLGEWNLVTIDVSRALADVPAAERPMAMNALIYLKMAVSSTSDGVVDACFDSWIHQASLSATSAEEFESRNSIIGTWDTADFRMFPSIELGSYTHVQRLNFADSTAWKNYTYAVGLNGSANAISDVQASGYPATLNHPGLPGGPGRDLTLANNAFGADIMETVPRGTDRTMIQIWDALLLKGVLVMGAWSSDAHRATGLGPCTYVESDGSSLDDLCRAYYEGRTFMADRSFNGRLFLTLTGADPLSSHAARYPVLVPAGTASVPVLATLVDGPSSGTVKFLANGGSAANRTFTAPSTTKSFNAPIVPGMSFVRVEVTDSAGTTRAMGQPITFRQVDGWPAGNRLHVTAVATPNGRDYNRTRVRGLIGSSYEASTQTLVLSLANPEGSIVSIRSVSPDAPSVISQDGAALTQLADDATVVASPVSSWAITGSSLSLKVVHVTPAHTVTIAYGSAMGDTEPPTVPASVSVIEGVAGAATLTWEASSDATGVHAYRVERDGSAVGTTDGQTTTFAESGLEPSTTYNYTVRAVDAAGNTSAASEVATLTTAGRPVERTFSVVSDTYVTSSSPSGNFGGSTVLRVDANPFTRSYLRFRIPPSTGEVMRATLILQPLSSQSTGVTVHSVVDTGWTELGISHLTAPVLGPSIGSSGRVTLGTPVTIDVTSGVSTSLLRVGGNLTVGLSTPSSTALTLASRESSEIGPALVVLTTAAEPAPGTPSGVTAVAQSSGVYVTWNPPSEGLPVMAYGIFRDGLQIASRSADELEALDETVEPLTGYTYQVAAYSANGHGSALSEAASVTTLPLQDPIAPTAPGEPEVTELGVPLRIAWAPSTDNVAVTAYEVTRDGTVVGTVAAPSFTDTTVVSGQSYVYSVVAADLQGNRSPESAALTVTIPEIPAPITLTAVADTYVSSAAPTAAYGTSTSLRVDGDGVFRTYVTFTVPAQPGTVSSAVLRLFANTSHVVGVDAHRVADTSWAEATTSWNTAPQSEPGILGSSGRIVAGTWLSINVGAMIDTALVTTGGTVSIALDTTSTSAVNLCSRQGANPPQVVITFR